MATKKLTVSVMNAIKVIAKVEEANQVGRALPPDAFYNQLIRCGPGQPTRRVLPYWHAVCYMSQSKGARR